jgi:hypothetical protein
MIVVGVFQARKAAGAGDTAAGREAEEAEQLLLSNKPLTDLTPVLTQLVSTPTIFYYLRTFIVLILTIRLFPFILFVF